MNSATFLTYGTSRLQKAGIGSARLDILIMLEDCLKKDRTWFLAHPEYTFQGPALEKLEKWLRRREKHEPLGYIRGFCEFYGRRFKIDGRVLQPRPESEIMISLLKSLSLPIHPRIADVGAGCGALGITAALEIPRSIVDLFEIDQRALAVAVENVRRHKLALRWFCSDLLSASPSSHDVILANLPYVPSYYHINKAASCEPRIAIFGGGDGLEVYRRLFMQLAARHSKPQFVLTESMPPQHAQLVDIAASAGFYEHCREDFIQVFEPI